MVSSGMAWQSLYLSLGGIAVLRVTRETHMARTRVEYQDRAGRHLMLIDDRDLCNETLTDKQRAVWHAVCEQRKEVI